VKAEITLLSPEPGNAGVGTLKKEPGLSERRVFFFAGGHRYRKNLEEK
jgi:hypothetical protein